MKKNFLWTLAAALALVGCSENELLEQQIQDENAIAFDTYVGDNAQTRATVIDNKTLGVKGFGVNAYYTAQDDFAEGAELNFMQNTKVTLNPDKGDNGLWEYSPVKYWPNNAGDKVSFFAYGPYAKDGDANGMVVNGTSIDFTVASEVGEQVDLIYNTNYAGTIDQEKQAVNERIHFQFAHALARIAFTVEAAVDETTNGTNLLDGNTRINVKKVALIGGTDEYSEDNLTGPFYTEGTLSLLEPETEGDSPWTVDENQTKQGFVFNATDHFYHTVKDMDAEYPEGEEIDVVQLTRFNASEPQRLLNDESYLMVIPQESTEFKIYIEYDVISGGNDNDGTGTYDESAIVNKITSTQPLTVTFEQGKAYNFNLVLGMTSVKFEASVADWEDENPDNYENEEWLPENVSAQINPNENGVFEIYNAKQLARMRDLVNNSVTYTLDEAVTRTGELSYAEASYILMDNIDLSEYENWTPIGLTSSTPFKGTFDGNGKSITGMTINVTDTEYAAMGDNTTCHVGLFNNVNNATIKGLSVNGSITTNETEEITWLRVGGIMGTVSNSRVYNCHFSGTLNNSQKNAFIGGIIGTCGSSYVVRCTTSGVKLISSANGVNYGGITGLAPQTISACYTYNNDFSSASNLSHWGGIVAYAYNQTSDHIIESCYNYDVVSTSIATNVGAILGQAASCTGQYLANCYSVSMSDVDAFVGSAGDTDKAPLNCGFVASDGDWTNALNAMNNALIELNTLDQNSNQYGLYNLKFETSESGAAYPLVVTDGLAEYVDLPYTAFEEAESSESGVPTLYIKSAADLAGLANNIANGFNYNSSYSYEELNYIQVADIDLSTVCGETIGSWTPIGILKKDFNGNYSVAERDENDDSEYADTYTHYVIKNLYLRGEEDQEYLGLFGDCSNASITNIHLVDADIQSSVQCTGGISGRMSGNGKIQGCSYAGTFKLLDGVMQSGAIVGLIYSGVTVSECSFVGGSFVVEGDATYCGGMVGYAMGRVEKCSTSEEVTMAIKDCRSEFGGVVGNLANGYAFGCINNATITAENTDDAIGGVVGWMRGGKISGCYNAGTITGNVVAGIVGAADNYCAESSYIKGCYNIGKLTGTSGSAGICGTLELRFDNYKEGLKWEILGCYNNQQTSYGIVNSINAEFLDALSLNNCFHVSDSAHPEVTHDKFTSTDNHKVDETSCKWIKSSEDGEDVICAMTAMNTALTNASANYQYSENTGDDASVHPLILTTTE